MADPWYFEVLPFRPPAYADECLSGYLVRLAHANGFTRFWDLTTDLFPMWTKVRQLSRLRWEYPIDGWGRLPLRTHLSLRDLRRLTVAPWPEKFRPPLILTRPSSVGPGHFLRGVVNPELQVCPLCLQEQPYLRLIWRLRWEYPIDGWGRLPLRTHLSLRDLRRLTVAPWPEKFRPPLILTRLSSVSPGHFLRGVVNPDLQVCPLCLQEQPYLRLIWRLAAVDVCLSHGCLLQTHCHCCGTVLTAIESLQRLFHCAVCGADWRRLPIVMAGAGHLATQQRRQAAFQFLLDPDVSLVGPSHSESEGQVRSPTQAIGLKFRYLRLQAGYSVTEMARRIRVWYGLISALEHGEHAPLPFYLSYLEALSISWPDFAALEVPPAFLRDCQEPPHLELRLCPTPTCPNHQPPPSTRVSVLADLPDQQKVRFRCTACGRRFTLTYDGALASKPRRPPIRPGESPPMVKPAEEIAYLIEMGLRGETNRQIAHCLGWGEKTVRIHWIALGLENEVHQAQAQRRAQEQQQRHNARRAQIAVTLQLMLGQTEEITLSQVSRALGYNSEYLRMYPDLAEQIGEQIRCHNAQVRQRRYEWLVAQTTQFVDKIKHGNDALTLAEVARQIGLSLESYRQFFPELHTLVREAIEARQAEVKALRTKTECIQVNEAAARLVAQGARLSFVVILQEAGLSKYRAQCDPVIHDLLQQWIGGFAPHD